MDPYIALALLVAAALLAGVAIKTLWQRAPEPGPQRSNANHLLPAVGEPATITEAQLEFLTPRRVDQFDLSELSRRQAAILIDSVKYIDDVWQHEVARDPSELSLERRNAALEAILTHASYLERVVVFEEAQSPRQDDLPKDGCYWHVVGIFQHGA